jgi:hypothetical protein
MKKSPEIFDIYSIEKGARCFLQLRVKVGWNNCLKTKNLT